MGEGTRVWAFAHVMEGAVVGRACNICDHTFVEAGARIGDGVVVKNGVQVWDGVTLEDRVFVGPNATFTNDLRPRAGRGGFDLVPTRVCRGATIGAGATVVCGATIGESAFVAAAALVVGDVPAHAFMAGAPARRRGWVCECARTLGPDLACACGRRYRLADEKSGLEPAS